MDELSDDDYWDDYWVPDLNGNPHYPYTAVNGVKCAFYPYHTNDTFVLMYDGIMYNVTDTLNGSRVYDLRSNFIGMFTNGMVIN
jgi:hypothetical protein